MSEEKGEDVGEEVLPLSVVFGGDEYPVAELMDQFCAEKHVRAFCQFLAENIKQNGINLRIRACGVEMVVCELEGGANE